MQFTLVIPALNEEDAIAGTLRRALAARRKIVEQTPVDHVHIVFVNDGCTDRTQEIVDQPEFSEVVKVNYGRNRGYGAAIKAGWQATEADLVGFVDADGTCDPDFCVNLINAMVEHKADVVLARRLEPNTQMPLIRKIGNRLFAGLLGFVSGHNDITDTASGFRIVKRESLKLMSPLPDGLHFTPAMSCICLLDPRLKIVEVGGMHYKEREGRSKLSVLRDGLRFLYTILFSACCYAPLKTMLGGTAISSAICIGLALLAGILGGLGAAASVLLAGAMLAMLMIATGVAVHQLNFLLIGPRQRIGPIEEQLQNLLEYKRLIAGGIAATALGMILLTLIGITGIATSAAGPWATAATTLLTLLGGTAVMGGVVVRVIWAVSQKQNALLHDEYAVRPPAARAGSSVGSVPPAAPAAAGSPH